MVEKINLYPNKNYQFIATDGLFLEKTINGYKPNTNDFYLYLLNLNNDKIEMHLSLDVENKKQNKNMFVQKYFNINYKLKQYIFNHHYIEISHHLFKDGTNGLLLKRQELSLKDIDNPLKENNIQKHFFYDYLFFLNDKFYLYYHDVEEDITYLNNYENIQSFIKENKYKMSKTNIYNNDYYNGPSDYQSFNPAYLFEYGEMFFVKGKKDFTKKILKHVSNKSIKNQQFLKFYRNNIFSSNYKELYDKKLFNYYGNNLLSNMYLIDLFKNSVTFKEFIFTVLKVPNSQKNIDDVYEIIHYYKYPILENVWHSFYSDEFLNNFSVYEYIDKKITSHRYYDEHYYKSKNSLSVNFYKSKTNKELQKEFNIYSKKINQLLKEKFIFVSHTRNAYTLEDNLLIQNNRDSFLSNFPLFYFNLFENLDNLQNFIKQIPDNIYVLKSINEVFDTINVYVPIAYMSEKDYANFSINSFQYMNFNKSEIIKKTKKYVNNLNCNQKLEENGLAYLTSKELKVLLTNTVFTQDDLEKSLIKFLNKFVQNKDFKSINSIFESMESHFIDLIETFYKIYFIYKNNKYKKSIKKHIDYFFSRKFKSIDAFEKELYVINEYIEEDKLKEVIPYKEYNYIEYDDYYFKQPSNGFELKYVGNHMHHCVFTYFNELKRNNPNQIVVVLYDKNNTPIVCLEIYKDKNNQETCVQAKLMYNEPVSKDKKLTLMIQDFCNKNNIAIKTHDIED